MRSASLTGRAFGKISKTSGSINTTFVPSAYRAAVTPRVALETLSEVRAVISLARVRPTKPAGYHHVHALQLAHMETLFVYGHTEKFCNKTRCVLKRPA